LGTGLERLGGGVRQHGPVGAARGLRDLRRRSGLTAAAEQGSRALPGR
jgi:hypothetical protein